MGSRQYIIPTDQMTLSDQQGYRVRALAAGIKAAFDNNIGKWDKTEIPQADPTAGASPDLNSIIKFITGGGWPKSLDVREFQPIQDAGTALDEWLTAPLAAPATLYSVFQAIANPAINLRANKLVVFYKVSLPITPVPVSRLVFRNNATGNFLVQYDLEPLLIQETVEGYFGEPFVVNPNMTFAIQVLARAIAGPQKVVLGNFVFEPTGQTNA